MLKDKTFTYRGHTFQVRATLLEKGWAVQVYEHEKPISPPYKITHDTAINYSTAVATPRPQPRSPHQVK